MDIIAGLIAGILVAWKSFSVLFDSKEDFYECVRLWRTTAIVSAFRGEFTDDIWASLRGYVWVIVSLASGIGVYLFFHWAHNA